MALSPALRSKAFNHNRSLSLPSKSNPAFSQFEETLSIVRASEGSCSSLSSMSNALNGLKNLYCKTGDLLQLPHTQRIISQKFQEKWTDQVLDGHVNLLDACMAAKDLVSQTKQNPHILPCLVSSILELAEKGHFIVYTTDKVRFSFPIAYLNSLIFRELLRMSEEEFGLPGDGPIMLPCDSQFMGYVNSVMQKEAAIEVEKALLLQTFD